MRGIAGVLNWDATPLVAGQIESLLAHLAVGQPDRKHWVCAGAAGLAHVLWRTAPEDQFEAQPLRNADGSLWLVADAVLENREELATAFGWSGRESAARPDSAFVLAAYERWGEACPPRLEGRWAFAVWHARERRAFAAVDVFACRPFYYTRQARFFAFASTLRPLLTLPGVTAELHEGVLVDFLIHASRHPGDTLYRSVAMLPAAHWLRVTEGGCTLGRYWRADPTRVLALSSDDEYLEVFRRELDRTVTAALRVEGPVGVMVSGGLDSAAITAVAGYTLAQRGRRLQALHQLPPHRDPRRVPRRELDESGYVRRLQAHLPHVDFHFLPSLERRVSFAAWDVFLDQHCVPVRAPAFADEDPVARAARDLGLRRVLFGFGGNYAISLEAGGCPYFMELAAGLRWRRLGHELTSFAEFSGVSVRMLVRGQILRRLRPASARVDERLERLRDALSADFRRRIDLSTPWRRTGPWPWRRRDFSVRRHIAWTLNELLPQHGSFSPAVLDGSYPYDGCSPFVNRRLNELCLAIPAERQIRQGRDRLLLREAMQSLLPDEVRWRRTRGLPTPYGWANARALVAVLPEALEELERSTLVATYLDLSVLRRCAQRDEAALARLGPTQFVSLFNAAWFLRWLERRR